MTDEEKAEITKEYLNNTFKQTEENTLAIMIGSKCFYEGLEKGLTEGRKENEELKADKEYLDKVNNEQTEVILKLNEQIEQLSNDNHVLKTAFITQQEQIEKMKCCGNCINRGLEKNISFPCDRCKRWHRKENYNDYWELAD